MMAYGPQDGGILTGGYKRGQSVDPRSRVAKVKRLREKLTDECFDVLEKIQGVADKYRMGMNQLAVKWVMQQPLCVIPIIGGSKPEHFDPLYEVVDLQIAEQDIQYLNDLTHRYRYGEFENQPQIAGTSPALNYL